MHSMNRARATGSFASRLLLGFSYGSKPGEEEH